MAESVRLNRYQADCTNSPEEWKFANARRIAPRSSSWDGHQAIGDTAYLVQVSCDVCGDFRRSTTAAKNTWLYSVFGQPERPGLDIKLRHAKRTSRVFQTTVDAGPTTSVLDCPMIRIRNTMTELRYGSSNGDKINSPNTGKTINRGTERINSLDRCQPCTLVYIDLCNRAKLISRTHQSLTNFPT